MKFSDLVMRWLREEGFTHCFTVAGGNSMHLLDGARREMTCVPVVHEVAAGIAVEYFNEQARARGEDKRAFALVTAGPGMTNILTAMAGAFLESRDLLVLGGQVKSTDLASPGLRQRGIQEIDGVALAGPVSVVSQRIETPMTRGDLMAPIRKGAGGRRGPVFLEFCLDAQAAPVDEQALETDQVTDGSMVGDLDAEVVERIGAMLRTAKRPVVLLGGGVSRAAALAALPLLESASLPVMTTWNGADRVPADSAVFAGRPNTWGQRSANILLQQCDLLLALGTRLGLQQTGFNWQGFAPLAQVVQVDLDEAELAKGHPKVDLPLLADADAVLAGVVGQELPGWSDWSAFCQHVRGALPTSEASNVTAEGYLNPYDFVNGLSQRCGSGDTIVPCSSGGAFTVMMQAFEQRAGQTMITDKGLASMGYGLSGAIGAALAAPGHRVVLVEGDGGFSQNLQELATVAVNALPIKVFIFSNEGYASIRMTQRNYFGGAYLGCDTRSGLGFPDWNLLFRAFGVPVLNLDERGVGTPGFDELFAAAGPAGFIVPIDPEQSYYPKITSRVRPDGGMESQPLHLMTPDIPADLAKDVLRYFPAHERTTTT